MVGTLETLSPNPLASLAASRLGEALTLPQLPAKAAEAALTATATPRSAATPATARTPERDHTHDHDGDAVRVELSEAATRLTQSGQPPTPQPPSATEALRSLRRAREAKQEGPLDAVLNKVRDDLIKVFRMFGKSDKEATEAAEAVAGKARDAAARAYGDASRRRRTGCDRRLCRFPVRDAPGQR